MLLLAFDTATPAVTAAIGESTADGSFTLHADVSSVDARRHGELLTPAIHSLTEQAGHTLADLDAIAVGVGNGLSSGALLTLGSDLAPRANTPQFLGAWRTITDCGGAGAPLLVSAVTALATLSVATGAVGMIGVLGGLAFLRWVPRFLPHPR